MSGGERTDWKNQHANAASASIDYSEAGTR